MVKRTRISLSILTPLCFGCGSEESTGEGPVPKKGRSIEVDTTVRDPFPSEFLKVAPLGEEDPEKIRKAKEGGETPKRENLIQEDPGGSGD